MGHPQNCGGTRMLERKGWATRQTMPSGDQTGQTDQPLDGIRRRAIVKKGRIFCRKLEAP